MSWSYSHYSLALTCLRKYKYIVVDKLVPEGPDSSDLAFGSALHSALNACLTGQDGMVTFEIYWSSYKNKELTYARHKWDDLAKIGAEFIRKFIKLYAHRYKLEFAEQRLYGEYRGIKFEGTPDFYGDFDGKRSLRDFKTSGQNYDDGKSAAALQLYLYAYLYLQNFPASRIDTLGYTVFNKAMGTTQHMTWDFDETTMYEALDNMVNYCTLVGVGGEFPKNYNSCFNYNRRCEFFDSCHGKKEKLEC